MSNDIRTDEIQSSEKSEKPSYYGILPAEIRYCKSLEPAAKILYTEITCLSNIHSYCWASNQYFADLYEVDVRTITRWISSLEAEGFIKVELESKGFKTLRKIHLNHSFNKSLRQDKNVQPDRTKMSGTAGQKCPTNNTSNNKEKIYKKKKIPKPDEPEKNNYRDHVTLTKDEFQNLLKIYGQEKLDDAFDKLNSFKGSNDKKYKSDYHTMIKGGWVYKEIFEKKDSKFSKQLGGDSEENRKVALEAEQVWKSTYYVIEVLSKAVEINPKGPGTAIVINYSESGFKDQLESALRKKNFTKSLPKTKEGSI